MLGQHLGRVPWGPVLSRNLLGTMGTGLQQAALCPGVGRMDSQALGQLGVLVPSPFLRQVLAILWNHLVCGPQGCPGHHRILCADGDTEDSVPSGSCVVWQNEP